MSNLRSAWSSLASARIVAGAAFVTGLLVGAPARADVLPDGKTYVPLALTIDGMSALEGSSLVLHGCSSEKGGRHQVAVSKNGQGIRCMVKLGVEVYAVPNKDLKPIEDLIAKDLGWAEEGMQARKLIGSHPMCGTIKETTLVDKSSSAPKEIAARYAIEKTATGCSIKKVGGETATAAAASAAPSASTAPAASTSAVVPVSTTVASGSPAPSASAPAAASSSAPPAAKSGCASAPGSRGPAGLVLVAAALGAVALVRRRRA